MGRFQQNIVTGCMVFSDMKHLVRVTGPVGTEQLPNNFALVDFCTMKMLTAVIGRKMLMDAKNIVRTFKYSFRKKSYN